MPRPTQERLAQVRAWLDDLKQLDRVACSETDWIMLKLSCSRLKAERLIAAAKDANA